MQIFNLNSSEIKKIIFNKDINFLIVIMFFIIGVTLGFLKFKFWIIFFYLCIILTFWGFFLKIDFIVEKNTEINERYKKEKGDVKGFLGIKVVFYALTQVNPDSEKFNSDLNLFIRAASIILNTTLCSIYISLVFWLIRNNSTFENILISMLISGLAPCILTTYFLWYLKNKDANLVGIFFITPTFILIHFVILAILIRLNSIRTTIITLISELVLILLIIFIAVHFDYVRK